MFVYRLVEPIDFFDGLTPLSRLLAAGSPTRTQWALTAVLALADAADAVGWRGDMRHLPMVGGLPTSPFTTPYLVVEQDDDGATFVIADSKLPWVGDHSRQAEVAPRAIGVGSPTTPTSSPRKISDPVMNATLVPIVNNPILRCGVVMEARCLALACFAGPPGLPAAASGAPDWWRRRACSRSRLSTRRPATRSGAG